MSVINVENNSPEIMTTASGLWYPLDDPVAKAKGIMPPTVVKVVMKIGRIRSFPEAMIASAVFIS